MHLSKQEADRIVNAAKQSSNQNNETAAAHDETPDALLPRPKDLRGPITQKQLKIRLGTFIAVTLLGTVPWFLDAPAWLSAGTLLPGVGIGYTTPASPGLGGLWALLPLTSLAMLLLALRPGILSRFTGLKPGWTRAIALALATAGATASFLIPPPGWDGAWVLQPLAVLGTAVALAWSAARVLKRGDYVSGVVVALGAMVLAGVLGAIHAGHGPAHAPHDWVPVTEVIAVIAVTVGVLVLTQRRDRAARAEGDRREALLARAAQQDPPPSTTARREQGAR